ncbi:Zinc finger BED domain-containing protein [Melia azedarach]|uniref:Zinc finger BED domain-containing protein n=1 Tax=Melia azedarach TaxID=155640 RepID=A0ACC1YKB2_MELAZ|nr:Zinc finger BED domain-containing protein [Melia azedarach]
MAWSLPNYEILAAHQYDGQDIFELIELNEIQDNNQIVNQDVHNSSVNNKRRKKESKVWEEMKKSKGEDGKIWAECTHCGKKFDGSSKKGTTHLKNHLDRCRVKRNGGGDTDKSITTSEVSSPVVVKEQHVHDLIKICFDVRGHPTEHWKPSVLNDRKVDILQAFKEKEEKFRRFLSKLSCRFSLRIEYFWGWYHLTIHYIDDCWEHKKEIIFSFQNAKGEYRNLITIVKEFCLDWKIDRDICSIVDYRSNDNDRDDVIGEVNSWFIQRSSLPFCGLLFPTNALSVNKAKSIGKEVTSQHLPQETVRLEDFEVVAGYKEAFSVLGQTDPDFKSVNLTEEQWDQVTLTYKYWKEFKDILSSLSEIKYTTPIMYFPKFCYVYIKLLAQERTGGYHLGKTTKRMTREFAKTVRETRESFEKYWSRSKLVLVTAAILDPRFKMDTVKLWYIKIYGDDADRYLKVVIESFNVIYNEYAKGSEPGEAASSTSYVDVLGMPCTTSADVSQKSELDRYLNDPKFHLIEKFDILAWWRVNTPIFPILARMARDFLAIPISAGAATSFSSVDLDVSDCFNYCEVLHHDIKQALLCLKRWQEIPEK